jgi:hypothetical protein
MRFPYGEAALALIAEQDIAAAAARVLLDSGHAGQAYVLTGAESLTSVPAGRGDREGVSVLTRGRQELCSIKSMSSYDAISPRNVRYAMPQPGAVSNCSPLLTLRPGEELAGNITTT